MRLFVEEGFQQTSTAKVSKDAGVATGTLFTYFSSKDDLVLTLYIESVAELIVYIKEKYDESDDPAKKLKAVWKQTVKWALDNPIQYRYINLFEASAFGLSFFQESNNSLHVIISSIYKQTSNYKLTTPTALFVKTFMATAKALIEYLTEDHEGKYDKSLSKKQLEVALSGIII